MSTPRKGVVAAAASPVEPRALTIIVSKHSHEATPGKGGKAGSSSTLHFSSLSEAMDYLGGVLPDPSKKYSLTTNATSVSPASPPEQKTVTPFAATIIVGGGYYSEQSLFINRSNIKIVSEGDSIPTIVGRDGSIVFSEAVTVCGIKFLAPDALTPSVLITGKSPTFQKCSFQCLRVDMSASPFVTDCTFAQSTATGLTIAGNASGEFRNCSFTSNFLYGAHIESDRSPLLFQCRFSMSGRGGIVICGPRSTPFIQKCTIQDSSNIGTYDAEALAANDKAEMKAGTRCDRAGILIANGAAPVIEGNTIFACEGHGIACYPNNFAPYRLVSTDSRLGASGRRSLTTLPHVSPPRGSFAGQASPKAKAVALGAMEASTSILSDSVLSGAGVIQIIRNIIRDNERCGIAAVASCARVLSELNTITDNKGGGVFVTDDCAFLFTAIHWTRQLDATPALPHLAAKAVDAGDAKIAARSVYYEGLGDSYISHMFGALSLGPSADTSSQQPETIALKQTSGAASKPTGPPQPVLAPSRLEVRPSATAPFVTKMDTFEDNHFFALKVCGQWADATVTDATIKPHAIGLFVRDEALVKMSGSTISRCTHGCVAEKRARLVMDRCGLMACFEGLSVSNYASAQCTDCRYTSNDTGVGVRDHGCPTVSGGVFAQNRVSVSCESAAGGIFTKCTLEHSSLLHIAAGQRSKTIFKGNSILETLPSAVAAVVCNRNALARFEDNLFVNHRACPSVRVQSFGDPTFVNNTFNCRSNITDAIVIECNGLGLFVGNTIWGGDQSGVRVEPHGDPTFRGNIISDHFVSGVEVQKGGGGVFERNQIVGNHSHGVHVSGQGTYRPRDHWLLLRERHAADALARSTLANTSASPVTSTGPKLAALPECPPPIPHFKANAIAGSPVGVLSYSMRLVAAVEGDQDGGPMSKRELSPKSRKLLSTYSTEAELRERAKDLQATKRQQARLYYANMAMSNGGVFGKNFIFLCTIGIRLHSNATVAGCQIGPMNGVGLAVGLCDGVTGSQRILNSNASHSASEEGLAFQPLSVANPTCINNLIECNIRAGMLTLPWANPYVSNNVFMGHTVPNESHRTDRSGATVYHSPLLSTLWSSPIVSRSLVEVVSTIIMANEMQSVLPYEPLDLVSSKEQLWGNPITTSLLGAALVPSDGIRTLEKPTAVISSPQPAPSVQPAPTPPKSTKGKDKAADLADAKVAHTQPKLRAELPLAARWATVMEDALAILALTMQSGATEPPCGLCTIASAGGAYIENIFSFNEAGVLLEGCGSKKSSDANLEDDSIVGLNTDSPNLATSRPITPVFISTVFRDNRCGLCVRPSSSDGKGQISAGALGAAIFAKCTFAYNKLGVSIITRKGANPRAIPAGQHVSFRQCSFANNSTGMLVAITKTTSESYLELSNCVFHNNFGRHVWFKCSNAVKAAPTTTAAEQFDGTAAKALLSQVFTDDHLACMPSQSGCLIRACVFYGTTCVPLRKSESTVLQFSLPTALEVGGIVEVEGDSKLPLVFARCAFIACSTTLSGMAMPIFLDCSFVGSARVACASFSCKANEDIALIVPTRSALEVGQQVSSAESSPLSRGSSAARYQRSSSFQTRLSMSSREGNRLSASMGGGARASSAAGGGLGSATQKYLQTLAASSASNSRILAGSDLFHPNLEDDRELLALSAAIQQRVSGVHDVLAEGRFSYLASNHTVKHSDPQLALPSFSRPTFDYDSKALHFLLQSSGYLARASVASCPLPTTALYLGNKAKATMTNCTFSFYKRGAVMGQGSSLLYQCAFTRNYESGTVICDGFRGQVSDSYWWNNVGAGLRVSGKMAARSTVTESHLALAAELVSNKFSILPQSPIRPNSRAAHNVCPSRTEDKATVQAPKWQRTLNNATVFGQQVTQSFFEPPRRLQEMLTALQEQLFLCNNELLGESSRPQYTRGNPTRNSSGSFSNYDGFNASALFSPSASTANFTTVKSITLSHPQSDPLIPAHVQTAFRPIGTTPLQEDCLRLIEAILAVYQSPMPAELEVARTSQQKGFGVRWSSSHLSLPPILSIETPFSGPESDTKKWRP